MDDQSAGYSLFLSGLCLYDIIPIRQEDGMGFGELELGEVDPLRLLRRTRKEKLARYSFLGQIAQITPVKTKGYPFCQNSRTLLIAIEHEDSLRRAGDQQRGDAPRHQEVLPTSCFEVSLCLVTCL